MNQVSSIRPGNRQTIRRQIRRGFTLVELMVVIIIAAVVASLTMSGFHSMAEGNQRVSCQTNLHSIYQGLRLYANDHDGFFPSFDPDSDLGGNKGLGLWALYAQPSNTSDDQPADYGETYVINGTATTQEKSFAQYVRARKLLHCPADTDHEFATDAVNPQKIDMNYLSYQVLDGAEWTYQPWRNITTDTDWRAKRQLLRFKNVGSNWQIRAVTPSGDPVITWCTWHRGSRDIDNVLFYSGVVRPVPKEQGNPADTANRQPGEPDVLTGWLRKAPF